MNSHKESMKLRNELMSPRGEIMGSRNELASPCNKFTFRVLMVRRLVCIREPLQ